MRNILTKLVGCSALALSLTVQAADPKIKVLLVTGDDVAPSHNWREMAQTTRDVLVDSGKFEVKVSEDAAILESKAALDRYDVVFMSLYNAKTPTLTDTAKENLVNFVKNGKGFTLSHLSSASFKEWPEFKALCGTQLGHGQIRPRSSQRFQSPDQRYRKSHHQGLERF